jgi:hypothetical protein
VQFSIEDKSRHECLNRKYFKRPGMNSTIISPPKLHERGEEYLRKKLQEHVPSFCQRMDRGAGDLISDLEEIIKHRLWERVGYDSLEDYASKCLKHSEGWCREAIRIYRQDWSPEQRANLTVSAPAGDPHAKPGNQNTRKKENNTEALPRIEKGEVKMHRVHVAKEAILNLTVDEQRELLIWANETLTE